MSVIPARPTARRSSASRISPSAGPSSGPTALPPPSPRVIVMTPDWMSSYSFHCPYVARPKASSSGCAPMKSTSRSESVLASAGAAVGICDGAGWADASAGGAPEKATAKAAPVTVSLSRVDIVLPRNGLTLDRAFDHSPYEVPLRDQIDDDHR